MTKTPKAPPLPQKGGSYTVDSRNRLLEDSPAEPPEEAPKAKKDVTNA
jgi:hypothetical protein